MEIADIFVVNKADREGADQVVQAVTANLSLQTFADGEWRPPVLKTEATTGLGVDRLWDEIERFRQHASQHQAQRRKASHERDCAICSRSACSNTLSRRLPPGEFERLVEAVAARRTDPILPRPRSLMSQAPGPYEGGARSHRHRRAGHRGGAGVLSRRARPRGRSAGGVVTQRVRARHIPVGGPRLELLEATASDSAIAKYIEKRGPGLHHVTLRVEDIRAALDQLKARGVRLVDEEPRPGAEDALVAFIHPSAAHGVLVELKQPRPQGAGARDQAPRLRRPAIDDAPRRRVQARRRRDVRRRPAAAVGEAGAGRRSASRFSWRCARCWSRPTGAGCSSTAGQATRWRRSRRTSTRSIASAAPRPRARRGGPHGRVHRRRAGDAPAFRSLRRRDRARRRWVEAAVPQGAGT